MIKYCILLAVTITLASCSDTTTEMIAIENPEIGFTIPANFPGPNNAVYNNMPTQYGVELGKQLFFDTRLSTDNSIACASCHIPSNAFADHNAQGIGVEGRVGLRNVPAIQNLAFMNFYNWDGSRLQLENQPLVPIITHEEMDSSILEVISKIDGDDTYTELFRNAFGDDEITPERIYQSIAQYEYTLVSANSTYDAVMRNEGASFTESEANGYATFQQKCASCHSTELFTDQSFRNVGFPINPSVDEAGRARVTGDMNEYMSFRVPSLRNVAYTAPYGSFGQFETLMDVLDYFDTGVIAADNLDPILKNNNNRIALTTQEKEDLIAFMHTLSDESFVTEE